MARTEKTRPWWVRVTERPMVTCRPEHDHRFATCDLPDDPRHRYGRGETSCYWTYANGFFYSRDGGCGCRMCTDYAGRRQQRRRDRHAARREAHDLVRAVRGGVDPIDL